MPSKELLLMFRAIWDLLEKNKLQEAQKKLATLHPRSVYRQNVVHLLKAEIFLRRDLFDKALESVNLAYGYFSKRQATLDDLTKEHSDLQLNFLEKCFIYWIFARAYASQRKYKKALEYAEYARFEWKLDRNSRRSFLDFDSCSRWAFLEQSIPLFIEFLEKKPQLLDLLVPEGFQPKSFKLKYNQLKHPLVTICIPSHSLVEAIHARAGYDRYEIVVGPQSEMVFAKGELIIHLKEGMVPCDQFIGKTVELFCNNPEVSLLRYGIACTKSKRLIRKYYFDEISEGRAGLFSFIPISNPKECLYYKPSLYRARTLGPAFCVTKELLEMLSFHPLLFDNEKELSFMAYFYGYSTFFCSNLILLAESLEEEPQNLLQTGYLRFSESYFDRYLLPASKKLLSKEVWKREHKLLQENLARLKKLKARIWKGACRSMREYWLQV